MMLETIVSLGGLGLSLYNTLSGVAVGQQKQTQLERLNATLERLTDHILWVPDAQVVRDTSISAQRRIDDLRDVKNTLEPVQRAFGETIIASAVIEIPDKMRTALGKESPWKMLSNVRPMRHATPSTDPDMVPIGFKETGRRPLLSHPMY